MAVPRFFRLDCPRESWGDYGNVLRHGIAVRRDGVLRLERTGPWIDPITFPGGYAVCTGQARDWFDASGLSGFTWKAVEKARIVELHWEEWDLSEPEPEDMPGDPEDYLLDRDHDPQLAAQMGDLFELVILPTAHEERSALLIESWTGDPLFRAYESQWIYADERAREWMESAFPGFVEFSPTKTR